MPPRRIALLLSLFFLAPAPALALEVGFCDTPQGLSAKLKAEGHKVVATMERIGVSLKLNRATGKKNMARAANLLTATPDLTRWYMVRAYAPLGVRSDRMCVSDAGRNLEINDHRKSGKPTVTVFRFDKAKALAECKALDQKVRGGLVCSTYGVFVAHAEKRNGKRIAVQGITDQNALMTIVANPGKKKGFTVLSTTGAGATAWSLIGEKFAFSNWVLSVLNKR